jgi:hypothetical protein
MSMNSSMSASSPDDRVAALAYALWLDEGRPEGRAEAHWFKALESVNAETQAEKPPVRKRKAQPTAKKAAPRKRS